MCPKRNLSFYLFTVLIFSLVYCCIFFSTVNAETELPPIPVDTDYDTDFDSDGVDFNHFRTEYGRENCADEPPCWFDSNLDRNVDDIDLAYFAADFGRAGKDFYESDDTFDQAGSVAVYSDKYQHHNFHEDGDEDVDWIKFFALENETYTIEAIQVGCDVFLELYQPDGSTFIKGSYSETARGETESIDWTCPNDNDPNDDGGDYYYVKVYPSSQTDAFCDAAANYELGMPRKTGSFGGTIYGIVKDAGTHSPIPYARIISLADDPPYPPYNFGGSAISFPNGVYIISRHPAGRYLLAAIAPGYSIYYWSPAIEVVELQLTRQDIVFP